MILFRFYQSFMPYIALRQEQITHWDQFKATQEALVLWSFAIGFRKNASNSDFIYFFMILYTGGLGQITPVG